MKEYVLLLCVRPGIHWDDEILCVEKHRPEWQKGRVNLPGGKIEEGESALDAANRELLEETGLRSSLMVEMGLLIDGESHIHCFLAHIPRFYEVSPREGESEIPYWTDKAEAFHDSRLIPNLRIIVPIMLSNIKGWTITDNEPSKDKPHHSFSVSI
jgi:8-oxo-dGTP diphosphatase